MNLLEIRKRFPENQPVAVGSIGADMPTPDGKRPNEVKFEKYWAKS